LATGIWTAVSGASAQSQAVDTVANNLANVDTLGFKKDQTTFKEYLSTLEREHVAADVPRGPIKDKDFYPIDGKDQSFVVTSGTHTNFRPGHLRVTQSPLDLALDGPGFFEVSTPQGTRFTRLGSLKVGADGKLVTTDGLPVLAAQTPGAGQPQLDRLPGSITPGQSGAGRR
jgi:flagellar basal-body rod protein FlgF